MGANVGGEMKKKYLHPMSKGEYQHHLTAQHQANKEPIETVLEGFMVYCPYCGPVCLSKDSIMRQTAEGGPIHTPSPIAYDIHMTASQAMGNMNATISVGLKEVVVFRCDCHLLLQIDCLLVESGKNRYTDQSQGGVGWRS